jgi:hypothetical protein
MQKNQTFKSKSNHTRISSILIWHLPGGSSEMNGGLARVHQSD